MTNATYRRKGLFWPQLQEGESITGGWHGSRWEGQEAKHSYLHPQHETEKGVGREVQWGEAVELSKPTHSDYFLQQGHTSPDSITKWGPSVQMPEPSRDSFHSKCHKDHPRYRVNQKTVCTT